MIRGRLKLVALLCEAAELEHSLLCQYLFAAFSFKRSTAEGVTCAQLELMRRWEADVLTVARQEMEHLALVCNLLIAIGEAPHLQRPNFPLRPNYYPLNVACRLEPFGVAALKRFIKFELPAEPTDEELEQLRRIFGCGFDHRPYLTIGALYGEIDELLEPSMLIGPVREQVVTDPAASGIRLEAGPTYEVVLRAVDSIHAAHCVVHQIITEGEGSPAGDSGNSHFARFCRMCEQLCQETTASPGFAPARPVIACMDRVDLESLEGQSANRRTVALVRIFDLAYETLLLMLFRFVARGDENAAESKALQEGAFFPMMTMVIRPLGELLTSQRVVRPDDANGTAGPRFTFTRPIALLPHRKVADRVIWGRLVTIAEQVAEVCAMEPALEPALEPELELELELELKARLDFVGENVRRVASNFSTAAGVAA